MVTLSTRAYKTRTSAIAVVSSLFFAILCVGCSSSQNNKLEVGSIQFTSANGNPLTPIAFLSAGNQVYLETSVFNDSANLGVDWSVACSSKLPPGAPLPPGQPTDTSCGTFTPIHTASGPVPEFATSGSGYVTLYTAPAAVPSDGIVTLYASSTSDHTKYASVSLTITGLGISIAFAPAPPSTLPRSGTASLKAVVENDSALGGVEWSVSCGSSACGSLSANETASGAATTYTAPSVVPVAGFVTITAVSVTDPTKSVSADIEIVPITITVGAAENDVSTGTSTTLSANVANDPSNAGVDWSLSCASTGACGTITPHTASGMPATYSAPNAVPTGNIVTVTATSTADPTVSNSVTLTITSAGASAAEPSPHEIDTAKSAALSFQPSRMAKAQLIASLRAGPGLFPIDAQLSRSSGAGKPGNFVVKAGYEADASRREAWRPPIRRTVSS